MTLGWEALLRLAPVVVVIVAWIYSQGRQRERLERLEQDCKDQERDLKDLAAVLSEVRQRVCKRPFQRKPRD